MQNQPPKSLHILVVAVAAVSLAGFVIACGAVNAAVASLAALAFAFTALYVAIRFKTAALTLAQKNSPTAADSMRASLGYLLAFTYIWGGLAMSIAYWVSGLRWQHGWQYGLGMVLIGTGIGLYARRLHRAPEGASKDAARARAVRIIAIHGAAAVVALVWLILSGKIATLKDDWAANILFVAGGSAVAGISAVIVHLHAALNKSGERT